MTSSSSSATHYSLLATDYLLLTTYYLLLTTAPEEGGRGADCERGEAQQQQHKEASVTDCLAELRHLGRKQGRTFRDGDLTLTPVNPQGRHLGRNVRAPARAKPAASGEGEHLFKTRLARVSSRPA